MTPVSPASSGASLNSIELRLGPSWQQAGALLIMHMGALVFMAPLLIPTLLKVGLSLLVVVSLVYTLRTHALRQSPQAVVRLVWSGGEDWLLEDAGGRQRSARLQGRGHLHPRLVILNFRDRQRGRRIPLVITPDALTTGNLRQLRVLLRLRAARWEASGRC